jgi:peptidoglycan/LPS O-acetylase OafA/YrhL
MHFDGRSNPRRFLALDGIRGIAALLIVFMHITWTNHFNHIQLVRHGYIAVDIFFILSGFVIYSSYSQKIAKSNDVAHFICLRFFRVYPLHFTILSAFLALELAKLSLTWSGAFHPDRTPFSDPNSIGSLIGNILLLQGLGIGTDGVWSRPGWNMPSWSISCEFVAYLLFGIAALSGLLQRRSSFAIGAVLATAGYGALFVNGNLGVTNDWGLVRCVSGFFFGMLIFELAVNGAGAKLFTQLSTSLIGALEVGLLIAIILIMTFSSDLEIFWTIPALIVAVGVLQLDCGPVAKILMSSPVQFLGRISYSIYMVHFFVIIVVTIALHRIFMVHLAFDPLINDSALNLNVWIGDLLGASTIIAILAVSSVTYAFIEEPARLFGRGLSASF